MAVVPVEQIGVIGKVDQVFRLVLAAAVQAEHIAGGVGVVDGLGDVHPAVGAVGDGLHHDVEALVLPVEDDLAEADVGGVVHDLPGDVVPHVVADETLVQVGAVKGPLVVGVHAHDLMVGVLPFFVGEAEEVALLVEIAGGVAPHPDEGVGLQIRLVAGVVVAGLVVQYGDAGGQHGVALGGGGKDRVRIAGRFV